MWIKCLCLCRGKVPAVPPKYLAGPEKGSFGSCTPPWLQQAARSLPLRGPGQSGAAGSLGGSKEVELGAQTWKK